MRSVAADEREWRAVKMIRAVLQVSQQQRFHGMNFFTSAGKESSWSVDGELLQNNHISAKVYRGLIEVFARGIEQ